MNYNFEWDPNKAAKNYSKHKVSFELAATIFQDQNALTIYDEEHSVLKTGGLQWEYQEMRAF